MLQFFSFVIYLPLIAFFISLLVPRKKEKILARLAIGSMIVHVLSILILIIFWSYNGFVPFDRKHIVLYKTDGFEFFIHFYFDALTATYAFIGAVITLLVTVFSRYYMHRDDGFKRFFNTLLFFYLGYCFVVYSGNFETLFIGWEILGITSFLLIAFYRDRYLPVKNALKVISLYRVGDVCLILAIWMAHHVFHKNITYSELNNASFLQEYLPHHEGSLLFMSLMIIVAVCVKSAKLPFSSWLPRAMEGPTTSSAIFYGSLSINLGAFLLQRTYPLWSEIMFVKILVIVIGLTSSIIATGIARVQSTVKTQIAYASITQLGLIFVEIALGFHVLALIHFAGNGLLRTYQLLVSPSVLSYLIHDQFFNFIPRKKSTSTGLAQKLKNTLYLLNIKEWNLDSLLFKTLWSPFKWIGSKLGFLDHVISIIGVIILFGLGLMSLFNERFLTLSWDLILPLVYAVLSLLFILKAFAERGSAIRSWMYIFCSQLLVALAICLNEPVEIKQVIYYLSGIVVAAITGYICLQKISAIDNDIQLNRFHGYSYEQPGLALIFFLSCLALLGFPFTPTFIGIDLLFTHMQTNHLPLLIIIGIGFILIEISALRIYARIFLGPHKKVYHPVAFRSS